MAEIIDLESHIDREGKIIWDVPRTYWEQAYGWYSTRFEKITNWAKRTTSSLYDLLRTYMKRSQVYVSTEDLFSREEIDYPSPFPEPYLLSRPNPLVLPAYNPQQEKKEVSPVQSQQTNSPSLEEKVEIPQVIRLKTESEKERSISGNGLASAKVLYFRRFCQGEPVYAKSSYTSFSTKDLEPELVSLYQSSDWTVREITEHLKAKYKVTMSSSTVARKARRVLGVTSRREARVKAAAA